MIGQSQTERSDGATSLGEGLGQIIAMGGERVVRVWRETRPFIAKTMRHEQGQTSAAKTNAVFEREQLAWMRAMRRFGLLRRPPPLAELGGWAITPDGVAQLAVQVSTESGEPAPSLRDIYANGLLDTELLDLLTFFAQELFVWRIPVYDLLPQNILLSTKEGQQRFLLVDGYGDRAAVPLKTWFPWLGARRLHRELERCANQIGCRWDRAFRNFVPFGNRLY